MSMYGVYRIATERDRQLSMEGYDDLHDACHEDGELVRAGVAYATATRLRRSEHLIGMAALADACGWPWDPKKFKPSDDPIRNLERAGALIAAEIDRLERAREESRRWSGSTST